ncbi:MAG: ABC transporter substrate-binding protein, partial [Candidatus Limnocylindrales bacterium]
ALAVEGKAGIDALVVKDGINSLADLKGKTIGVKGALPPGEIAMLLGAGLKPTDYKTVSLEGFAAMVNVAGDIPVDGSSEASRQLEAA